MTAHEPFDEAVAAYALDALDPAERPAFEDHLSSCARCQAELRELRRIASGLGIATETDSVELPADLKARVIGRATAQPQMRAASASARPLSRPASSMWPWLALAASIVVLVGVGSYAASLQSEVQILRQQVAQTSARAETLRAELVELRRDSVRLTNTVNVLGAPDLIKVDLRAQPGASGARGRAFLSAATGLLFRADQLPAPKPGRVYQVWVIARAAGSAPLGAGVLVAEANGAFVLASTSLPIPADRIGTVAVTDEPGPIGSAGPTTPVLLAGTTTE